MTKNKKFKPPVKPTHDALFRAIIDDEDRATALLRDYLPEQVRARMDETPPKRVEGSFVDQEAKPKQSDALFEITLKGGRPALAYVLLEHKSVSDLGTPLQLLGYMQRIWSRYAGDKAGRLRALPVVIPLVFFHGQNAWNVPQRFGEMFDAAEDMARYVPSFRYEVHDLGRIPVEKLSRDAQVMAGLAALKFVQHRAAMTPGDLAAILSVLADGTTDFAAIVARYVVARYDLTMSDVERALDGIEDEGGKALMGTLAETWKQEGKAEGLAAGEALGREKGLAEGRADGEARSLMRLLVKRFGPLPEPVVAQIAAGSIEELDRWLDRVFDGPDLESVFAERRDH